MVDITIDLGTFLESTEPTITVEPISSDYTVVQDNDTQFEPNEETELLRHLKIFWNPNYVHGQKATFYLMSQYKTHDLATGPSVVVYYTNENSRPYGIGYIAESTDMSLTIEIHTLTQAQLFDAKKEIFRILNYIRKRPFLDYDIITTTGGRRVEPQPGVFMYTIDAKLVRYVKNIAETGWGRRSLDQNQDGNPYNG